MIDILRFFLSYKYFLRGFQGLNIILTCFANVDFIPCSKFVVENEMGFRTANKNHCIRKKPSKELKEGIGHLVKTRRKILNFISIISMQDSTKKVLVGL